MTNLLIVLVLAGLGFILWLTVDGLLVIYRRSRAESAARPLSLVLSRRQDVAGELMMLQLRDRRGRRLPAFEPGQYVLVQAPAGPGGAQVRRAYSLAAWLPRPDCYELGIKREERGVMTRWLWDALREGQAVCVSRPQGHFVLEPGQGLVVLIAGGIGITPMRAMLHAALAAGRPVSLFHAARHAAQLLYREEFEALAGQQPGFRYQPVLSCPDEAWRGWRGRLEAARVLAGGGASGTAAYYLCAGTAMMDALDHGLQAAGVPARYIHREAFGAGTAAGEAGLTLSLTMDGAARTLATAGEPSLLACLEANAVALPSECRAGSCGQCALRLVEGEVDWLLEPEFRALPGQILPCVCSARTGLRLALP